MTSHHGPSLLSLGSKRLNDGPKVVQQVSTEPGEGSSPLTLTFSFKCYLLEFTRKTETIETHIETNTQTYVDI